MNAIYDPSIREREYLLAIGRALTQELELSEVLKVILHCSAELVHGLAGVVILSDPALRTYRVAATIGIPPKVIEHFRLLGVGFSYDDNNLQEVLAEVKLLVKEMAEMTDPDLTESLGLAMRSGEQITGAIFVFSDEPFDVNPNLARFLQSFAAQAAIAVRNAQLYEDVLHEKQRLNAILQQSADGVMILNHQLQITTFNKALCGMTNLCADDVMGHHPPEVISWERLRSDTSLKAALANGWPYPHGAPIYEEGDMIRSDGKRVTLGVTYAPLLDSRGKMTSIIANVRDLTRFREEEKLHKTFISVISHELKTPVAIIKGYAGTISREDADWPPEVIREYMGTIEEEADALTDLIDNLLEASRLQAGTFELSIGDDISLEAIARSVAKKFATQTEKHTFDITFSADFPQISGDERRLTQVFNNLLSNAIKYSPDGGVIRIVGETVQEKVKVTVADQGIGIPESEHQRIFQQFSRVDNALSRRTEGTGLGLFLTKAIVEAHNGSIWFTSTPEQPGTTFTFTIPQ